MTDGNQPTTAKHVDAAVGAPAQEKDTHPSDPRIAQARDRLLTRICDCEACRDHVVELVDALILAVQQSSPRPILAEQETNDDQSRLAKPERASDADQRADLSAGIETEEPCPACGGEGKVEVGEYRVTRDMAIDAGAPEREGAFYETAYAACEECRGSGTIPTKGEGN